MSQIIDDTIDFYDTNPMRQISFFKKNTFYNDIGIQYGFIEERCNIIERSLKELEAIKNAKPSVAMKCLFRIGYNHREDYINGKHKEDYSVVEQALLKAQKQEQELAKYKQLEEEIGCPLEVRCEVVCNSFIYGILGNQFIVTGIYEDHFIARVHDDYDDYDYDFEWKDYKQSWWLKEDRSE